MQRILASLFLMVGILGLCALGDRQVPPAAASVRPSFHRPIVLSEPVLAVETRPGEEVAAIEAAPPKPLAKAFRQEAMPSRSCASGACGNGACGGQRNRPLRRFFGRFFRR